MPNIEALNLEQVRNLINSGELSIDLARKRKNDLLDRTTSLGDYLETRLDRGEIANIGGILRQLEIPQRDSIELTTKILELKHRQELLLNRNTPQQDPELITLRAQLQLLNWLTNK